ARQLIQTAMLGTGAWLVIDQHVTGGVMIAATILLSRALAPVEMLVAGWRQLIEARSAWRQLAVLLEGKDVVKDKIDLPRPSGNLRIERATYAVAGAERPILRGLEFSVAAGECLGIVGPSASGKSTL